MDNNMQFLCIKTQEDIASSFTYIWSDNTLTRILVTQDGPTNILTKTDPLEIEKAINDITNSIINEDVLVWGYNCQDKFKIDLNYYSDARCENILGD